MLLKKFKFILGVIMLQMLISIVSLSASHIKDVEAITEVFGDGEDLSAVILTYDKAIKSSSISVEDYSVADRKISRVYVNTIPQKEKTNKKSGKYVIIELEQLPMVDTSVDPHPEDKENREKKKAKGISGPTLGSKGNPQPLKTFSTQVTQKGTIKTIDNKVYKAEKEITSSHTRQLIIEDFIQGVYKENGKDETSLMYNLYIPKNYDPNKKYPLVVFMHDAGVVSSEIKATLSQGLGAIAWASPEWQKDHPCFVLAPQYDTVIVNDKYEYGPELDRTIKLIEELSKKYSIDTNRIYNTGQSMGGMSCISLDSRYPDFFAASYIVASKWDVNVTDPLAKQKIWFVVSEGDPGAYPSINEITKNLENKGASVKKIEIDANQKEEKINSEIKAIINPEYNVYYTIYKGGSHRYTWQHAYEMFPAMEWVFSNHK